MNQSRLATLCLALGLAALLSANTRAEIFTDATNEIAAGIANAGGTLDFVSMEVTDNASDVVFQLTVNGNTTSPDWGNFMIGIATTKSVGSTTNNGWGRPIYMNVVTTNGATNGMTHWIGSWVGGGGVSQFWTYDTTWSNRGALPSFVITAGAQSTLRYTVPKTSLGVTTGDTVYFDAYSSGGGGGDSAVDALANPSASITAWGQVYTSSTTNNTIKSYTLSFVVSDSDSDGLPDTWETEKFGSLSQGAADDPDSDSLTNAQEFAAGTNPSDSDSDDDTLNDGLETNTGVFVSASNPGTNPLKADSDNDGTNDAAEITANTNPNKPNYSQMTVAGNFQGWVPAPAPTNNPINVMSPVSGEEFGWQLNFRMSTATNYLGKFAAGSWSKSWGASPTNGIALSPGTDIPLGVTASGIWRFYFNTDTLIFTFTRQAAPATYADWAAQYGLAGDSQTADPDMDTLTNNQEFAANTDPQNSDTDGDGLFDVDETSGDYSYVSPAVPTELNGKILNPLTGDSDGDGLRDLWEITNGLDATDNGSVGAYVNATGLTVNANPNGGTSDPDNDGLTNLQEQTAGSNPRAAGTGFASTHPKVVVAGNFVQTKVDGNWDEAGNAYNTMQLVGNFTHKLLVYLPGAKADAEFKFTAGSWSTNWGDNSPANGVGDDNGANISLGTTFTATGWYAINFNDFSLAYSAAAVNPADGDTDGLPDEWEVFYGGYLNPKTSNLVPTTVYVPGGLTAAQAYAAGSNPVRDTVAPTIALAAGVDKLAWVALGGTLALGTSDVTAADNGGTPTVTISPATVDTSVAGTTVVTYTATDADGNTGTVQRTVVVGDAAPGWRAMVSPAVMTVNVLGSGDVYGQIYVDGATSAAGAAPNIQAWVGVNAADTDPATWNSSAWSAANFSSQQFANDEYKGTISGAGLTPGTPYYYAFRWQIGSGAYTYGGIKADGSGAGPWDGTTNRNGALTVQGSASSGSTFAGWSSNAPVTSELVAKYAIGGAANLSANDGVAPSSVVSGGNLVLTAIVRTDDPKLTVEGEAVASLADYATPGSIITVPGVDVADQTGVPAGHKKKTFTVSQGLDAKKFLRLKAILAP